jgi:hypothetical protein
MDPEKNIKVALGQSLNSELYTIIDFSDFVIKNSENPDCMDPEPDDIISMPHSNSFLDLDGDCMPDIFLNKIKKTRASTMTLFTPYYEIYT